MAGELSLKTPLTGLVTLVPTNTATDKTITLPATTGTMVVQDATNTTTINNLAYTGTLTGGTGVVNIGSGQVYKDASGNVGIGTASPQAKLSVSNSGAAGLEFYANYPGGGTGTYIQSYNRSGSAYVNTAYYANSHTFWANGDAMVIASTGNVGIGTASNLGSSKLDVRGRIRTGSGNSSGDAEVIWSNYASATNAWTVSVRQDVGGANNDLKFLRFDSGGTFQGVAMQLDSSGRLLVGTTSAYDGSAKIQVEMSGQNTGITTKAGSTSASYAIGFYNPNGVVGGIVTNASATAYNTSSDYRLKDNVAPMQNALATVAALKPVTYTWKSDGSDGQGFIAHELQTVVPDCVTGTKDAVDKDGNPEYQGVDTSFLVATLTAAIQELTARLEVLENK